MHISGPTITAKMESLKQQCENLRAQREENFGNSAPLEIIVISKNQSKDKILPLLEQGHKSFGENRVQEAKAKWPELKKIYGDVNLHFVGPLQTNKLNEAIKLFDYIHSLDRIKLAAAFKQSLDKGIKLPKLFIQINVGSESQKGGIDLNLADNFIKQCVADSLPIIGLMCIPPADENPAPYFALLKQKAETHNLPCLSMGMSSSLKAAILLGATHIRPGKIIF